MSQCLFVWFFLVSVSFESPSLMGFMSFSLFIEHLPWAMQRDIVVDRTDKTHSYRKKTDGKWYCGRCYAAC